MFLHSVSDVRLRTEFYSRVVTNTLQKLNWFSINLIKVLRSRHGHGIDFRLWRLMNKSLLLQVLQVLTSIKEAKSGKFRNAILNCNQDLLFAVRLCALDI